MYVDDLLSGSATDDEALQAKQEISELMKLGGFDLTNWASNSTSVIENIPPEETNSILIIT